MRAGLFVIAFSIASPLFAQNPEPVRITEDFGKGARYHVRCQVEINGSLSPPGQAKPIKVVGKSTIKYDERILSLDAANKPDRTVRYYGQLEFERKVGDDDQMSKLRPEVQKLVILRHKQYEVPFCPTSPLTWGEIELVRTDVFAPALQGLFPAKAVRVGDRWKADNLAIQELTDLEKIEKADFECTLDKITTLVGRRTAHVQFEGKVQGIGEDGNALHELRGSYYVDLDANFLSYLYVKGTHHLLDKSGKATGKIDGSFLMTRTRDPATKEIDDEALRGLTLEPNADNTLLLFEHPQIGVRFLYPRNWRIAGFNEKQIGIDENKGSGVLINLTPAKETPTGKDYYLETINFLAKQQARFLADEKVRSMPGGWETFGFEAEVAKERVFLQYYTTRQGTNGMTMTARILPKDRADVLRDIERMVKSVQLRATK